MCISVTKAQRTKATSPQARKPDCGGCSVILEAAVGSGAAGAGTRSAPPAARGTEPASSAPRGPAPGVPGADRVSPRETP